MLLARGPHERRVTKPKVCRYASSADLFISCHTVFPMLHRRPSVLQLLRSYVRIACSKCNSNYARLLGTLLKTRGVRQCRAVDSPNGVAMLGLIADLQHVSHFAGNCFGDERGHEIESQTTGRGRRLLDASVPIPISAT
jgi:hypothetical protein